MYKRQVLEIAGKKSKQFQKFGMDKVTDDMLEREMTVNVNVGMGNTDPVTKMQKFLSGIMAFAKISLKPPPGVNLEEVFKEVMALSGYSDGERFSMGNDPEKAAQAMQLKQLQMKLQQLMIERRDKSEANQVKRETATQSNIVKLLLADKEDQHENIKLYAGHLAAKDQAEHQAQLQAQQAAMQPQQAPKPA